MNNMIEHALPLLDVQLISVPKTIEVNYNSYTFFIILEGKFEVKHESDQFILKSGDVYFMSRIPAGSGSIYAKSSVLIISIAPGFISQHIPAYPFQFLVNSYRFPEKQYGNLLRLLMELSCSFFSSVSNHYQIMSLSYELLHELDINFTVMAEDSIASSDKHPDRIRAIASFVNKNYSLNITQSDMAQHLYLSPQHCSRFFRQHFQMTFLEYLNYVRMQHALDQIQYSNLSITQIAFQNGFPNLNSFNRVFREHKHTTPSEYRKKYIASGKEVPASNKQYEDPDTSLQSLKHYEKLLNLSNPVTEHTIRSEVLTLHAADTGSFFPAWDSILNTGLLSDCLMNRFHMQLMDLQQQLHFQYVRFHGILDDTIISQIPGTNKYNFQNVDTIFDFFSELKLTPFIEIGNKPKIQSFALSTIETFMYTDIHRPYSQNLEKLHPFIKHCIHRYGIHVVENWYFEIWMDFDLYFHTDQFAEALGLYVTHYTKCHKIIKALVPNAQVGGPGFNTVASFSVLEQFLQKISLENIPIDFISAYLYPYESGQDTHNKKREGDEKIVIGPEQIIRKRTKRLISALHRSSCQNKKLFITEYHFSVSPRNHMNDSCFQAPFILKTLLENEASISGFGYFRSLDLSSNYADVVAPLYGGSGLITKDNIKKPSFYAYQFLNSMNGKLLEKGDGYMLTLTKGGSYALLLYYYLHPEPEYLLLAKEYPPTSYSDNIFLDTGEKQYHIEIGNVADSQYIVRHRFLNKDYGSILDEWISLNTTSQLGNADISYLKNICIPHQSIRIMDTSNQRLDFSVMLMPHEIRLIEITPASDT